MHPGPISVQHNLYGLQAPQPQALEALQRSMDRKLEQQQRQNAQLQQQLTQLMNIMTNSPQTGPLQALAAQGNSTVATPPPTQVLPSPQVSTLGPGMSGIAGPQAVHVPPTATPSALPLTGQGGTVFTPLPKLHTVTTPFALQPDAPSVSTSPECGAFPVRFT